MPQSPHAILYGDGYYPTALHLFEALKFLPHRPDIAEMIRQAPSNALARLSKRHARAMRADWDYVAVQMMDEALYHKFCQHVEAREVLLGTGSSQLVFEAGEEPFRDFGLQENGMARSLERVRSKLLRNLSDDN
ncbi:hypothetical protein K488DRAFT_58656 [Vararia minispora EC-137]|uniref:Uncharacterized protein n=1 Tax=Vararia minispora EC-137 TaxID=1314806 RepID=A0ACB8Q9P9_9AGAM|nr:hypothetical protein K488DRAFT_58656 [Vararia minispora EC-137]